MGSAIALAARLSVNERTGKKKERIGCKSNKNNRSGRRALKLVKGHRHWFYSAQD